MSHENTHTVNHTMQRALIVWVTNQNSFLDIYSSRYVNGYGWQGPLPVKVSNENKTNPKLCCIDTTNFVLVYQTSSGDIFFKRYFNNIWLADTNLTQSEPQ